LPVGAEERRVAINESLFREVNERIGELGELYDAGAVEFVCECGDADCAQRLTLTIGEYERVRASPDRFFLVPGHERLDVERVVEDNGSFVVVEKTGEAGAIAEDADPRAD
jgi:hypothetical protein